MQDPGSFLDLQTGKPISAATVTSIINRQMGTISNDARVRVVTMLRQPLNVMGAAQPPGWAGVYPWDPSDIAPLIYPSSASVSHDTSRHGVARQLDFSMIDPIYVPGVVTYSPATTSTDLTKDLPTVEVGFPFDPTRTMLQASQVITCPRLAVQFEVFFGYFISFLPSEEIHPGKSLLTWSLLDLTSLIAQAPLLSDWVVYRSYPGGYLQAVVDLLTCDSIPASLGGAGVTPTGNDDAGPAIPASMIPLGTSYFPDDGNQEVLFDVLLSAGMSRLDAVNQLLAACNYYPLWVDHRPYFRSKPIPDYSLGVPLIDWDYSTTATSSIVSDAIQRDFASQSDTNSCNIARVEGTPSSNNVIYANVIGASTGLSVITVDTVVGLNLGDQVTFDNGGGTVPDAPHNVLNIDASLNKITIDVTLGSTYTQVHWPNRGSYSAISMNTGINADGVVNSLVGTEVLQNLKGGPRAIGKYEKIDKIANQAMAELYAHILTERGARVTENASFPTLVNPLHEDHDTLLFLVTDKNGVTRIPSSTISPFIETAWTLDLKGAKSRLSHTLERIVIVR